VYVLHILNNKDISYCANITVASWYMHTNIVQQIEYVHYQDSR